MTRTRKDKSTSQKATSQRDLARRLKVSRSTVDRLRQDGLSCDAAGHYDVEEAREFQRMRAIRLASSGKNVSQDAVDAKFRKLCADANMSELKYAVARGEFIARQAVVIEWRKAAVAVKSRFLGLGRELAPHLAHRGPQEIQATIDKRVFEILRLLAQTQFASESATDQRHTMGTHPALTTKED